MRDLVPLRAETSPPAELTRHAGRVLTILVPVGDAAEWARLRPAIGALAVSLTIDDPVEIAIGLDGAFDLRALRASCAS